jgi:hypothetical protein
MKQAESYTVEEVKARVSEKAVVIGVSSKRVEGGNDEFGKPRFKTVPELVGVACEGDIKPELVLSGPKQQGEVNVYVFVDGRKHYFDAKTGVALGSQLRPNEKRRDFVKLIPPSKSDATPAGTDRRYIR